MTTDDDPRRERLRRLTGAKHDLMKLKGEMTRRDSLRKLAGVDDEIIRLQEEMIRRLWRLVESVWEDRCAANRQIAEVGRERDELLLRVTQNSEKANTRLDFARDVWSGLRSSTLEALLHSVFHKASQDVIKHYDSPEVSITGALVAYLCTRADEVSHEIQECLQSIAPGTQTRFIVQHLDCQRDRDIGGADLVLVLDVSIPGRYERVSFCAFQAKKSVNRSLSLTCRGLEQLDRLRCFTSAAYYLLYAVRKDPLAPSVIPARALASYLAASSRQAVSREALDAVSIALCDYFTYDFLPGWSGDERRRDDVDAFVTHVIRPAYILRIRLRPEEEHRRRHQRPSNERAG